MIQRILIGPSHLPQENTRRASELRLILQDAGWGARRNGR
jgi:hypothetical protein